MIYCFIYCSEKEVGRSTLVRKWFAKFENLKFENHRRGVWVCGFHSDLIIIPGCDLSFVLISDLIIIPDSNKIAYNLIYLNICISFMNSSHFYLLVKRLLMECTCPETTSVTLSLITE